MDFLMEHLVVAIAIMFVIIACRIFQANVALALGDDTPKLNGATSLNPVNHIDITGFICFLLFKFGWAKPLQVNVGNFKNRFWGKIIYSLSNAVMCFLIALISAIIYLMIGSKSVFLFMLFRDVFSISIVFGIIGLIPLPPFDGAIFVSAFLSREVEYEYFKLSSYTTFILLALILTRTFGIFLTPAVQTVGGFILKIASMLVM
ncbi:site-2 protease family protein [Parvimonas parva]|uniref:Site-2 protease family protein n=1 Tax=Parvimonas parva TaxID=2769485 RepID=A0ABS1C892_9FIRM|nr:site-2 protease family protein [Parvimonas parva]MBK1468324.1 site-2 protease family protein [Parvimonas parva]